jgi:hypothetical protein
VMNVMPKPQVANLRCLSTGMFARAHIDRCRVILEPSTESMKKFWQLIQDSETSLFSKLMKPHKKNKENRAKRPRKILGAG